MSIEGVNTFGNWLRIRRRSVDLTQLELAEAAGCAVVTVRKIEAGERRPSKQLAERLAEYLKLPESQKNNFVSFARSDQLVGNLETDLQDMPYPWQPRPSLNNLPADLTPLLGRSQDLAAVYNLLTNPDVRLVTIMGPPGVGKTRLSIALAGKAASHFADGVFYAELAPVNDAKDVSRVLAHVLNIRDLGTFPAAETLKVDLANKELLLVLDNFEHLIAAGSLVVELLKSAPGIKVLTTSRSALEVSGEVRYSLPPLLLPDLQKNLLAGELAQYPSIELFAARAAAIDPKFRLKPQNLSSVAEICIRLDGLPLAIELAAARIDVLSPLELLTHLDNRLSLLIDGPRDFPGRQRTLLGAIEWSYELLTDSQKHLFSQLSVFSGGFRISAAEFVVVESRNVLEGLSSLLKNSLLLRKKSFWGTSRLSMLETIHEFALKKLIAEGKESVVRERHADFFISFASMADAELRGPDQLQWLDRLEHDRSNFRVALSWLLNQREIDKMLTLAGALARFWELHSHLSEGRMWLDRALVLSNYRATTESILPNRLALIANVLRGASALAQNMGKFSEAELLAGESLKIYQDLRDARGQAYGHHVLGLIAQAQKDYEAAANNHAICLKISQKSGDKIGVYIALYNLAEIALAEGDIERSNTLHEQSLALKKEQGDLWSISWSYFCLAKLAGFRKEWGLSQELYEKSLILRIQVGDKEAVAESLVGLADVAVCTGRPGHAARLLGGAYSLLKATDSHLSPNAYALQEMCLAAVKSQLIAEDFEFLFGEGLELRNFPMDKIMPFAAF